MAAESNAQTDLNFIKIGETNPSVSAYVFGTGEQLSGQQFQTEGITTYKGYQYTVYYNITRNVCIARRKLPVGNWEEVVLPYKNSVDDAHNTISMGICANDGSIHLSYDHHNDKLHYSYSIAGSANDPDNMPWEASSFCATTDIMDKAVENVTYPRFISKPDGNLIFECRFRWSGWGDSYLREYDGNTKKWSLVGRYVQGEDVLPTSCAYINGMTYDNTGKLHITWCWRDDYGGGTNHDFSYAYSEDHGRTWKDNNGDIQGYTELMDPVESLATGTCLGKTKKSLIIEAIPYNKGYINQETQSVDSKGRIHAVNSHIPGTATDSNWGSSRKAARLHHRFREADGTWKTVQVKKNGELVNSYCRVNLSFDAFDNAFVVANGAEIYTASSSNGYDDWGLMSDTDNGRFLSEPLVDRALLKSEGILSFVYLGADNKITVIDYLLDNPNIPNGEGLKVEYFSDNNFSDLIAGASDSKVSKENIPSSAKSARWSGTFETSYAENYTLYINTNKEAVVYIDGVKVLLTKNSDSSKEYSFNFSNIPSHKHNIVIESQVEGLNDISLSWESKSVTKQIIPVNSLYSVSSFENIEAEQEKEPELTRKAELDVMLSGAQNITDKTTITFPSFNPQGDYSLEIQGQIISSDGDGLIIEGRDNKGKGLRISIDETSIKWKAPYSSSRLLNLADNSQLNRYRIAVKGSKAYIYINEDYCASSDLVEIGNINDAGEEIKQIPESSDCELLWAGANNKGTGKPTDYGWDNALTLSAWNTANGGSGVRYLDVTDGHTYEGSNYKGRLLTLRWDGSYGTYSYPVTLDANSVYEFSMLYEWWNNGSPSSIVVGLSSSKSENDMINVKSFPISTRNNLHKAVFNFTSNEAGTYYLIFNGQSGAMYGIGELELKKHSYQSQFSVSKLSVGASDIRISKISYENGAYAPGTYKPESELEEKKILTTTLSQNTSITGLSGSKDIVLYPLEVTGDYSLEIAATVANAEGRGMDFEVKEADGTGFRTSINDKEFLFSSPFAQSQIISSSDYNEQIIRYAVKDEKVYVYRNGKFVRSFSKQNIGNMNDAGTSEIMIAGKEYVSSSENLIVNPDFKNTADNGAPTGWTSNGTLGSSPNARVQLKSSTTELSAYPDGTKAFVIRFDGSYQWFSNKVTLKADTWYEYSFDLIGWGTNTNRTLDLKVSTLAAGSGDVIASAQLTTPSAGAAVERAGIRFKTNAAGDYYISYIKNGTLAGLVGLTDLSLVEKQTELLIGKNYTSGSAAINVRYLSVDNQGAYAPSEILTNISVNDMSDNDISIISSKSEISILSNSNIAKFIVNDLSGRQVIYKENCGQSFNAE